jgi:hypothetical protein
MDYQLAGRETAVMGMPYLTLGGSEILTPASRKINLYGAARITNAQHGASR